MAQFKMLKNGQKFDPMDVKEFTEDHFLFIRRGIHPVIDGLNTGYNFALRSNLVDNHGTIIETLEVTAGTDGVKARLSATDLGGWGMGLPNPHWNPNSLIREIIFRLKKDGVVFFEEDHEFQRDICTYIAENIARHPKLFVGAFGEAILVMDDPYRPQDVTVRFVPRI